MSRNLFRESAADRQCVGRMIRPSCDPSSALSSKGGHLLRIEIDIATKVYRADDKLYRLFPGERYRHFTTMRDNSVVFLDYPHIGLPGTEGYSDTSKQLDTLVRSEQKAGKVRERNANLYVELAEIDLADLGPIRWSQKRALSLAWLNLLYRDVRQSDLIIVPGPIPSQMVREGGEWIEGKTLIGEIVDGPFIMSDGAPEHILLGQYTARRVRWLAEIDERDLPREAIALLRTRNPLIELPFSSIANVICAAHKNVAIGENFHSRFTTDKADFSSRESFHFTACVLAFVAMYRRIQDGTEPISPGESIYTLAAEATRDELVPFQESSIFSPGFIDLIGKFAIPIGFAAFYALISHIIEKELFDAGPLEVRIVNSESIIDDPSTNGMQDALNHMMEMMGRDNQLQETCGAVGVATENDGLKSSATCRTLESEDDG